MGFCCPPEVKRLLTRDQYASFLTEASEAQYRKNVLGKKVLYMEEVVPRALVAYARKGEVHHQRKYVENAVLQFFKTLCPASKLNITK